MFSLKQYFPGAKKEKLDVKTTAQPRQANVRAVSSENVPAPKRLMAQKDLVRLQSENDLPCKKWTLLTSEVSEISINAQARSMLAVLEMDDKDNTIYVICRSEVYGDALFYDVVDQILRLSKKEPVCAIADAGFIAKLYGKVDQSKAGQNEVNNEVVEIIDRDLVQRALELKASDIHINISSHIATIRMRRHGRMVKVGEWDIEKTKLIANVLFNLADEKTKDILSSEDVGQSMSITRTINGEVIKLRYQSEITYPNGMHIVMRVLKEGSTGPVKTLPELGYADGHVVVIERILTMPEGIIIIAGTTGSGKTTSLLSMMYGIYKNNPDFQLYSVEAPPEYVMEGVTQIPAKTDVANGTAATIRNLMRMDPDVMMVGEIRDMEELSLVTQIVLTGHKALSTLHAASAFGICERLLDIGISPSTLSGQHFIAGFMFQKLLPELCPHCREEYIPSEWPDYVFKADAANFLHSNVVSLHSMKRKESFGPNKGLHDRLRKVTRPGDHIFIEGKGCDKCEHTGIIGRTVCAEVVTMTDEIRSLIGQRKISEAENLWLNSRNENDPNDMTGLRAIDHAIIKMRKGIISPVDLEKEFGLIPDNVLVEGEFSESDSLLE